MVDQSVIEKLNKMKKQLAEAKSASDKAEGALQQLNTSLKEEFEVENLDEAERLLRRLERDERLLGEEVDEAVRKLEADYAWA